MAEREHREMAMEGSFDSFQDAMEGAMDLKYRELRGEGGFLIHEEASTFLTGQSDEVPTQDEPVGLTAEVKTWLKYADEKRDGVEVCKPQPITVQQHDLSRCSEPSNGATLAEPGDAEFTSRNGDSQPIAYIAEMTNGHREVPDLTNTRSGGLPNHTSSLRRKPIPGRETTTVLASTTQTTESSRSPAPFKGRQDSAQTVIPQATAAHAVASQTAQVQERYPLYTGMDRKQDLQ
jgi:hypothetical protein